MDAHTQSTLCWANVIGGAQAAAALGLFDDFDFLAPELYPFPGTDAKQHALITKWRLGNASLVRRSDGSRLSIIPNLSWLTFGGKDGHEWQVPLNQTQRIAQAMIAAASEWNATAEGAGKVSQIIWWSGDDSYPVPPDTPPDRVTM